jgi:truncated hemoglobin YjbI
MYEAHKGMNLTDKDFDAIVDNLVITLKELKITEDVIKEVGELLETLRNKTLGRKTLFERIGGQEAVNMAVDQFYKKVLVDTRVNSFFKNTDMKKQAQMQKDFIT